MILQDSKQNFFLRIILNFKLHSRREVAPSLPRNVAFGTFGELLTVFSAKLNLLFFLYSTSRRCFSSASDKARLLKTFLVTLILMTLVSLYLLSLLELI